MLDAKTFAEMRELIHQAIDDILDDFRPNTESNTHKILHEESIHDVFEYTWPDLTKETYYSGQWFQVVENGKDIARFLVAHTSRLAWGKARPRIVVFLQGRSEDSKAIYPLAEFVACDSNEQDFASKIPDPRHPQRMLKEGDPLPKELKDARVERVDKLFDSIQKGPSLRRIVNAKDEIEMVDHAFWIGRLKKRF